ncbi:MAG: apolipoprotein N-acyltransferase [Lentisphaeria bacterium]|nr:apolipoprotein N-acyltransferase [Lentisphaeria bacterium]
MTPDGFADAPELLFLRRKKFKAAAAFCSLAGGMLYAAALPPLNWSFAVFFALLPLFYVPVYFSSWKMRIFCGWLWGVGWSVFAFNFLREIHPAVPYMLAPVISVWPAVFTFCAGFFAGKLLRRQDITSPFFLEYPLTKQLLYLLSAGALFTLLEWTRYYLFVWNDLSVTCWKLPELMQIARFTGRYGVTLLITLVSGALFALIFFRKKRFLTAALLLIYPAISLVYGIWRVNTPAVYRDPVEWKCALIQGDLPQQRRPTHSDVVNSIIVYARASLPFEGKVDTVLWPECAVPIPYRAEHLLAAEFRKVIARFRTPLLMGALDYTPEGLSTNSALLIYPGGAVAAKYDKYHRVPYGEYVPFRSWLPESWVRAFDMGRDLAPGKSLMPLKIKEGVFSGTAVCYEGVFSYVANAFARNKANVLAALSNDVWYPESSEPEQHLANAVMRCVETGLPMVRCGNNGGSGVVTSTGVFTQYVGTAASRPELLREAAAGVVSVTLERTPEITVAVRYENWLILLLAALLLAETIWLFPQRRQKKSSPAKVQRLSAKPDVLRRSLFSVK